MNKELLCESCGKPFITAWSDEEANQEAEKLWGVKNASQRKDMSVVCDDCFEKLNKRIFDGNE